MKNLKKILIALAVLAVLISSVAVVAVAIDDSEYTGTLTEAKKLLTQADSMDGQSFAKREASIVKVYTYLEVNPVDPMTKGYARFAKALNTKALVLANDYLNSIANKKTATEKADSYKTLVAFLDKCPIDPDTKDPDGEETVYVKYDVLCDRVVEVNYEIAKLFYDEALLAFRGDATADPVVEPDRTLAMTAISGLYTFVSENPVDQTLEGYAEFYAAYNLLSLEISESVAKEFSDSKSTAPSADYRKLITKQLNPLRKHIAAAPVDLVTFPELQTRFDAVALAVSTAEFDEIAFLYSDFEAVPDEPTENYPKPEVSKEALLAKAEIALNASTIPETTEGYAELVEAMATAKAKLEAAKEERRKALDDLANLADFELTDRIKVNNFSSDKDILGTPNKSDDAYGEIVKPAGSGVSGFEGYMRYVYGAAPTHCYTTFETPETVNGFTVQFDIKLDGRNGEHFKTTSYSFRHYGKDSSNTQYSGDFASLFEFKYDSSTGTITAKGGSVTVKNVAAEGQWFNVIVTMDPTTRYGSVYVNYEYMFDIYYGAAAPEVTAGQIRGNGDKPKWCTVSYDNYSYYEGTGYRILNKFDGMSDNDKFVYYVNYFLDAGKLPKGRNAAYSYARMLLDDIKSQYESTAEEEMTDEQKKLRDLVVAMEGFDYQKEVAAYVREENIGLLKGFVDKVLAIDITSANVAKINSAISALDAFVAANSDFIDKADERYINANQQIAVVKDGMVKCQNAVVFARALTQFSRATTVASMTKRAAVADEIFALARYDRAANAEFVSADPAILAFETLLNGKDMSADDEAYVTAFEYYKSIPATIAAQVKVENSRRVIDVIALVLAMNGYEDTEAFWLANYEELDFYISIVRDIVSVDNYSHDYPGIDEAVAKYELIDEFFYKVLQDEHIAIISAQLDRFPESDSYIEKVGICTYLDRYFAENHDINLELEEIKSFVYRLDQYKKELEVQIEDYKDLLEQNTRYFIDAVNKMNTLSTYAEIKPLYDEALTYYYAMNVETDEARAAVASYNYYEDKLESIEINSKLFQQAAVNLRFATGAEAIYEVLVECVQYYEYTDATYSEKVADAIVSYEAKVAEYNNSTALINAEIEVSADIVASLRANQVPVAILAIANQYYESN